jgi:hypothetical protein
MMDKVEKRDTSRWTLKGGQAGGRAAGQ